MKLGSQLQHRAMFDRRKRRARRRDAAVSDIPFPTLAAQYYTRGIRALIAVIREAVALELLPWLPSVIAQHNATRPDAGDIRIDADPANLPRRIAIIGPPRAGKTTEALRLGKELGLQVHHADDLISLGWSEASAELARRMGAADSGVFEGVAVVRAMRKLLAAGSERPVDRVLVLNSPHVELNEGQRRMARGHETVWLEIAPELSRRGVELVFDVGNTAALTQTVQRKDETGKTIDEAFARVAAYFSQRINSSVIKTLIEQSAERVSNTNRGAVVRQIKQLVNVDVFVNDAGLAEHLEAFVSANVQAVIGLTDSAQRRLHGLVLQGARQGLRYEALAKQLRDELQVSERRAANLARDQLGTLNAELTQLRQTELGVTEYDWITSRDERVRKGHKALDGTRQRWATPPVENPGTGARAHPGQAKRCRCTPRAVVENILAAAGMNVVQAVGRKAG